jgi:hypothetical protein
MAVEEGVAPSRLIMEINGCCCGNLYKLRKRPTGVPPYKKNTYRLILLGEPLRGLAPARVGLSAPSPSRLSCFALSRYGGSATIPLAKNTRRKQKSGQGRNRTSDHGSSVNFILLRLFVQTTQEYAALLLSYLPEKKRKIKKGGQGRIRTFDLRNHNHFFAVVVCTNDALRCSTS